MNRYSVYCHKPESMNMKKLTIPVVAISALVFSNCTTTNPYTGAQQVSKLAAGSGAGAIGGAILGAVIGNNTGSGDAKKGALYGAGVGAAGGAGIGYYMDKQEAKIREQLNNSGVSVTRSGNDIILNLPENITFDSGSSSLRGSSYSTLKSVALVLKEYQKTTIAIGGYTDSDGSSSYNQGLSERRASSVGNYLGSQGVSGSRLNARGYGESSPVASNSNAAGKAQNRRVELRIEPIANQF